MKKFLFIGLATVICIAVSGCSDREQKPPDLTAKNQTQEEYRQEVVQPRKKSKEQTTPTPNTSDGSVILDVPLIKQNPELKYGCEVTSLAMVLKHAGIETDKLKLADEMPKDNDPMKKNESGDITHWGDPNRGFVGDVTGQNAGYAIYAEPLETLMKQYLEDRTVNLTRKPFNDILQQIKKGKPVILWTTGDYKLPDRWESWQHGRERIKTPLDLHAVVLVGFDKDNLYINDPLSGQEKHKTNKYAFLKSWDALGQQALSYN